MKKRVRIGLVGLGYWGLNYSRVLMQSEEVKLECVCEKDYSKLKKNAAYDGLTRTIKFSNDSTTLAKDKKLEAVIIATPASTHYEIAKAMLEAGKHVLVEKPLTINYQQALELHNLSERMGKILMVGHIYCFSPAVNYLNNILRSRQLGDLYYGIGLRLGLGPIRNDASCTWDLATHDIAILNFLLGKMPTFVSAQAKSFLQREKQIYDYATLQFNYDDGFRFTLIVSWYAAEKIRTWYLMGSKNMLKFDDMNKSAPITIYNKSVTFTSTGQANTQNISSVMTVDGDTIMPYVKQDEPLSLEVRHFVESIETGKKPIASGEEGAKVVRILEAIEESIRSDGKRVSVQ